MGVVLFYQLTRSTVEQTARTIVKKALEQGWRVMIRGTSADALSRLDGQLWLGDVDEFLPHGLAGGAQDADQPVLLGTGPIGNAAQGVMLIDGAEPLPDEISALQRVWILFDGNDQPALEAARIQWKVLTGEGHPAQYWSEDSGRWEKKAEFVPK